MKTLYISVFAAVLVLSFSSHANELPSHEQTQPAWLALTLAYPSRADSVIKRYLHSKDKAVRLYAAALDDLSHRHFRRLPSDGAACYKGGPRSPQDATAYFGCLVAVSSGLGMLAQPKLFYLWRSKLVSFYGRYKNLIESVIGSNDPTGIMELSIPGLKRIKNWPKQTISVKKGWSTIPAPDGIVTVRIDGKSVPLQVDTGATGIMLSYKDIVTYGLGPDLKSLGVKTRLLDSTGGYVGRMYLVKKIDFGPIVIHNAYISTGPGTSGGSGSSIIGINVLSKLGRFVISPSRITRSARKPKGNCARMMFARFNLESAATYPFLKVQTNEGRLGLYLDSGFRTVGPFKEVGVFLDPTEKRKLVKNGIIDSKSKSVAGRFTQNGKTVVSKKNKFNVSVFGIPTEGIFFPVPAKSDDPMVAGAMTFNFLKKAKVAYDFPDRKMCIIPDSQPTAAASG